MPITSPPAVAVVHGVRKAAVAAAFAPSDLAGMTMWLDAPALALSNGAAVTAWNGKAPTSVNFVQATGANQPTYATNSINGLATVHFGAAKLMTSASTMADVMAASKHTLFVVAKVASSTVYQVSYADNEAFLSDGAGRHIGWGIVDDTGSGYLAAYRDDAQLNTSSPATYNTAFQGAWDYDAGTLRVRLNGGAAASVASIVGSYTGALTLGRGGSATSLNGDIGELIMYSERKSDADRQQVEAYLRARWALP